MASQPLTPHDLSILEKIKDPEASSPPRLLLDDSLARDPNIPDPSLYSQLTTREHTILSSLQQAELQIAGLEPASPDPDSPLQQYRASVRHLGALIATHPNYASARNNRAQALRRLYGNLLLVRSFSASASPSPSPSCLSAPGTPPPADRRAAASPPALDPAPSEATLLSASATVLSDLDTAIALLAPRTPATPLSPQAARTLAQAYTQRGALYHFTAKALSAAAATPPDRAELRIPAGRRESRWGPVEFEEAASSDFVLGGRCGSEVAKALAVAANPTAKLCGEIVRGAMRKEFAGTGAGAGAGASEKK
ncbi:uncharacterized protein L3040_009511 [Drepanopeziza brunnea f. sp. 'multigermtubi']|uniref:Tetratricopeptide repeat protein 36 n=1 Tax=Marssonina brunnea f. sp. multigermtubi (strain MB_m1) TaxID=1072389 RepID=K1XUB7_MARBU|nr:uncharacterized protein MBM_05548 [Drepanopeziza brunnea f. sp. 'multigermtubi' MB_m1]EKD16254.1 hypothetical protein MBM_05548 [Drepanopeziza brunnea f. sp. 'multigermtubi' MB_m1]KAJ5032922.1 hypothetical protein L3040_009511 [Drepanopeziza brunnea f. sp. 'multigermtubi']